MSDGVAIVKVGDVLLASIQTDLSDESALALQEDLSRRVVETGARGVIVDISQLEIVDSYVGRMLSTIAAITRVLDARTIAVGMRPAVAITLTELGLSLGGVRTALNADRAFEMLRQEAALEHSADAESSENLDGEPRAIA